MTASFAAYASQFLNRQQHGASSMSSSSQQPMFFSFTTDEGSRAGNPMYEDDIELDDEADPHLQAMDSTIDTIRSHYPQEDDDPYLRLDEDDPAVTRASRHDLDSLPLIATERPQDSAHRPVQGWLAHQLPLSYRSPSPPRRSDSSSSLNDSPPPHLLSQPVEPPPPTRITLSLTESLLPRDGQARPRDPFSLPDPRRQSRNRVVYEDSIWTSLWLFSVSACYLGSFIILFTASRPKAPKGTVLPYSTLLHSVPLIAILTFLSAVVSYAHIMLLNMFAKPVLFATSVFIPVALFLSALWAFIGSFMWDADVEPTWGETVGLRLFALIPLTLALYTSRRLTNLPRDIHVTSSILSLSTKLLMANPYLLALSPMLLLSFLLASIPFITLTMRLLLMGYLTYPTHGSLEWHVANWASWAISGTVSVWLWTWGVSRGILRTACAGVIGAWYFQPPEITSPSPTSTHRIHAALYRATSPSLGSIAIAALLLTGIRILTLLSMLLRRAPMPILPWLSLPLGILGNMTSSLSTYALVYVGLTGDAFFASARRARALTAPTEGITRRLRKSGGDPSLAILTITPLTLTLPFALATYLFVAHTLLAPDYAPMAALLAGGTTALVGKLCVALVEDTADALYLCYCIDRDVGEVHRQEVFDAFEGVQAKRPHPQRQPRPPNPPSTDHDRAPLQARSPMQSPPRAHVPPQVSPRTMPARALPVVQSTADLPSSPPLHPISPIPEDDSLSDSSEPMFGGLEDFA